MKNKKIIITENKGQRIDLYLSKLLNENRNNLQKNIEKGNILVNDKIIKKNYLLKLNDVILINNLINYNLIKVNINSDIKLDIKYEDDYLLIINKPKGLVVYPGIGREEKSLLGALLNYLPKDKLSNLNKEREGIVNRLDKDTEGLLIVAKDNITHEKLKEMLKSRLIKKTYYAICLNRFENEKGLINLKIKKDDKNPLRQIVSPFGKEAITEYKVLSQNDLYSLLEINLITGRTHQIRVHLSYLNHPLLGDNLYNKISNKYFRQSFFLCSKEISFIHPMLNKKINIKINLSKEFQKVIKDLNL